MCCVGSCSAALLKLALLLGVALFVCYAWLLLYRVALFGFALLCFPSLRCSLLCLLLFRVLAAEPKIVEGGARWGRALSWTGPTDPGPGPHF